MALPIFPGQARNRMEKDRNSFVYSFCSALVVEKSSKQKPAFRMRRVKEPTEACGLLS